MTVRVVTKSRLQFVDLFDVDGYEFWDLSILPQIPPQVDDSRYQVTGPDRIDNLAQKFYGDPRLWWVIAVANNLEIIPTTLNVGMKLRIPSPTYVANRLFMKKR
jgi:hypothetical protein